jgi:hypothetical protein
MYTLVLNEGIVFRHSDAKIVAPCQSADDPDFIAYNEWVEAGNQPVIMNNQG